MAKKYTKVGVLMRDKKDPNRFFIKLGDSHEKFGFNAQVATFKGSKDSPVDLVKQENGFLSIFPPRNENAPDHIVGDICIGEAEEE